ncbi:trans-sialidase, putative, partial [Trypanosoma cruzi]
MLSRVAAVKAPRTHNRRRSGPDQAGGGGKEERVSERRGPTCPGVCFLLRCRYSSSSMMCCATVELRP